MKPASVNPFTRYSKQYFLMIGKGIFHKNTITPCSTFITVSKIWEKRWENQTLTNTLAYQIMMPSSMNPFMFKFQKNSFLLSKLNAWTTFSRDKLERFSINYNCSLDFYPYYRFKNMRGRIKHSSLSYLPLWTH